ncbi:MAG TPA: fatty acid desaturase [Vicinamibacterales bacterium]|nr:fatty acid desaturase [Vicinamibacterales bacterium]
MFLRGGRWDALFVALSIGHAGALIVVPSIALISIGLWWNANTIAHNFIHRPFFRARLLNRVFSAFLSLVLGVPQSLWRDRHLAHHAGVTHHLRVRLDVVIETVLLAGLWTTIAVLAPRFFLTVYLPGVAIGLTLCQLQGFFEHAGGTTSHYGRVYNFLFFNDGYHVEHHSRPGAHWTQLREYARSDARRSRWPPVLRWLDHLPLNLESLERLVLRSPRLQRFVIGAHERAFRRVLAHAGAVDDVLVVGGGLFPRTAIVLRRLLPSASITIVDANDRHLALARPWLDSSFTLIHDRFDAGAPVDADLVVIPLSFAGDRRSVYADPPAALVVVHDWIWSRAHATAGAVVSWLLLKKLNVIVRAGAVRQIPVLRQDSHEPIQRAS